MRISIRGIQQAQAANNQMIAAIKPGGALGRAVQHGTAAAHRYAVVVTHVDTGALRASHRMALEVGHTAAHGRVYIDPQSVNPHGQLPSVYGVEEHGRGGEHAFYERTVEERGQQILGEMAEIVKGALP